MGTCKDEMKPSTEKAKSLFGLIQSRKKKAADATTEAKAQTFTDKLIDLEETLKVLIIQKEADARTESGRESYNKKALAHLLTMQFHIDHIVELAAEYTELK